MKYLVNNDLQKCINAIPDKLINIIENNNVIIAGGFIPSVITNSVIHDLDLYTPSSAHAANLISSICNVIPNCELSNNNTIIKSMFLPYEVNVIQSNYASNFDEVISKFDFTICSAAIMCSGKEPTSSYWVSYCNPMFYMDLAAKRISLNSSCSSISYKTIKRIIKYVSYGYHIEDSLLKKIVIDLLSNKENVMLNIANFDGY